MLSGIKRKVLPISIIYLVCSTFFGLKSHAAVTNGADIYCFMRNGGNEHEPSWQAAYQFIKNKKQGLFKTSPKQAATLIVEEVVQDPIKYQDCINYLGDLYTGDSTPIGIDNGNKLENEAESSKQNIEKSPKGMNLDRYNY
tara:strand:+ start:1142 stop:1564 length:423 start_codon:yes stop_codon:yes gene_type:complete